jgi:enamine deaminase RidA (YjgF/YER057c/UK114 family)
LRYSNPDGMTKPTAYSQVVEVNGPHRIIFIAGQTGVDASGNAAQGFRAQAMQVFENIKAALNSVGGDFEHVVKLTTYLTDIEQNADTYREVRASFFANKATLPASTLLQITGSPVLLISSKWKQWRSCRRRLSAAFPERHSCRSHAARQQPRTGPARGGASGRADVYEFVAPVSREEIVEALTALLRAEHAERAAC